MGNALHSYVAVVDDDEGLGRSFGRLLRAAGYQAVVYSSAETFLADSNRPVFDCLVLDVQMEGMDGIELARQLASSGSTTPVVFITAHDDPDERTKALLIPGTAYLHKSDPAETVLAAIQEAVQPTASSRPPIA